LTYNGHKYFLISENSATGAEAEAHALSGYLATISSEAEHNVLWNAWKNSLGTGQGLWIGLERANYGQTSSPFVWMNGEPVAFTVDILGETAVTNLRNWIARDGGSLVCYRGSPVVHHDTLWPLKTREYLMSVVSDIR